MNLLITTREQSRKLDENIKNISSWIIIEQSLTHLGLFCQKQWDSSAAESGWGLETCMHMLIDCCPKQSQSLSHTRMLENLPIMLLNTAVKLHKN